MRLVVQKGGLPGYNILLSGVDSIRIFIVESEAYMYLLQAMNLDWESLNEIKNNRFKIMTLSLY
jgi:hypothetical protein